MSTPNAHASSSREATKDKKKSKSKDKDGKSKSRKHHKDKSSTSDHKSSFERRSTRMRLSIPPKYALDWLSGVKETLDAMLMRYVPQLEGVLLAHWDHDFCDDTVKIIDECPYGVCEVEFKTMTWAPKVGQKLYGTHSLSSPSHLSLLFARTFNISIPFQHIPQDLYKFEHTDLPEDEEEDSDSEMDEEGLNAVEEVGRWRNVETDKLVGEEGTKGIEFTVIGMQVDNNVLSLTGSLLADPTNPPPPPSPILPARAASLSASPSPEPQPPKQQRIAKKPSAAPTAQLEAVEEIDERFLSARELKKKRKDDEKKKRDARKARKEEKTIEAVESVAAEAMVDVQGITPDSAEIAGSKRKAKGDDVEGKKKRRV